MTSPANTFSLESALESTPKSSREAAVKTTSRRQFLQQMARVSVAAAAGPMAMSALAESEFERWKRAQQQQAGSPSNQQQAFDSHRERQDQQFQQYHQSMMKAYKQYTEQLSRVWSEPEMSDRNQWVEYSDDLDVRRTVDFANNEVRVSFTGEAAKQVTPEVIAKQVEQITDTTVADAYDADPVLKPLENVIPDAPAPVTSHSTATQSAAANSSVKSSASQVKTPVLAGVDTKQLLQQVKRTRPIAVTTPKGKVVTVTVPLLKPIPERAKTFEQQVRAQAKRWNLPLNLVFAVMETESTFNPMARSHIPAFGLMQIVPHSAGRDATKHAWGKDTLLTGKQLLVPETNIELGCAYLNLLNTRYLKAVKNDESRLYCVIAAYNTGAGNVARSFTGKTSVKGAAAKMNRLSPAVMKRHLMANLHYEEARHYVAKVTKAMPNYPTA